MDKIVFISALVISISGKNVASSILEDDSLTKHGDLVIGALLPFHRKDSNGECTVLHKDSLLWIKALSFALDELKKSQNSLPQNATLGLKLFDTCSKTHLEQSLEIVHRNKRTKSSQSKKVIAVISSNYEANSSTLFNLFRIPQVLFSDIENGGVGNLPNVHQDNFESLGVSFFRARALIGFIKYFGWDSVSVVVGRQYNKDFLVFKRLAELEDICIAVVVEEGSSAKNPENVEAASKILLNRLEHGFGVQVVLVFTSNEQDFLGIIRAVEVTKPAYYTLVDVLGVSRGISTDISRTNEYVLSLRAEFQFLEEFRNHVSSECHRSYGVAPGRDTRKEYLCQIDRAVPDALRETLEGIATGKNSERKFAYQRAKDIQGIVNGVLMVGQALSRHMGAQCWDRTREECLDELTSHDLTQELQYLIHQYFQKDNSKFETSKTHFFKRNLFSLVSIHGNRTTRVVGTWDNTWYINSAGMRWAGKVSRVPKSSCSPVCPVGYVQVAEEGRKCCWSCEACNYNQYTVDNYTCADCVRGYWPSRDHRTCEFKLYKTITSCAVAISSVAAVLYALVI